MKRDEHSYHFIDSVKIFPLGILEENGKDVFHPT
jgi:hypothetical protein